MHSFGQRLSIVLFCVALCVGVVGSAAATPSSRSNDTYIRQIDDLSALWSFYKQTYIQNGRVVSLDENGITTSEGQGYAMLRAVWSNDRATFNTVWAWTKQYLQVRDDKLFAWKWKGTVLDKNSATDADTDIALALILAARRFGHPVYEQESLAIINSIWNQEMVHIDSHAYVTAGNWARDEDYPTIHVAYLAPYAYEIFASVDSQHPWAHAIASSYAILHWLYDDNALPVPPELIYLDTHTDQLTVRHPVTGASSSFSYDASPIFWRVALDAAWFGRSEGPLRQKMLGFFQHEWKAHGEFVDRYSLTGLPLSSSEGLPLYATVHALAFQEQHDLARLLSENKLAPLEAAALAGKRLPYYFQNWLWFGQAVTLSQARHYDEFLGFLRPFDVVGFSAQFPWELFTVTVTLYLIARWHPVLKVAFLICGFTLCLRYLHWRLFYTLNVLETGGLFISVALWAAELYAFSTVVLLFIQVGVGWRRQPVRPPEPPQGFAPSVDIFIPIYSESCEILKKTLIGASAIEHGHKRIYVLDDSHREEVCRLAERFGATYIKGPRQHAKAGNLNHALTQTDGELIAVFDTDHIPVTTFLTETVPFFADPKMGFVQTPHHFYNQDIFQRALGASPRIPNEQDLFNHAIQGGRQGWHGAFFVGSGAVFRRSAIADLNGFNLMSITEDIHTSQHLHARGWKSAFVDKDLAVGLTAENLASYIVQRRRWTLGCLQIFFKDNPLLCRGLSLRHRLGYFASLYYFFFPVARVVFWITPLYFLMFHLHPIFADVSILVAYLLPFMVVLPMISATLLPGWPRLMWSSLYEGPVSFPLFRSMFDLLLPKNLGFKVTPKGLLSEDRLFDWRSSASLTIATVITLAAIAKGLWEFWYFGIEKDAYFFNLSWASFNLLTLLAGLLIAWEKPQRRTEERILKPIPFELRADNLCIKGISHDVSLTGLAWCGAPPDPLPATMEISLLDRIPFTCQVQMVYHDRQSRHGTRCGLTFLNLSEENRRLLLLNLYTDPATWGEAHANRLRSSALMAGHLLVGLLKHFTPLRLRRRQIPRYWRLRITQVQIGERRHRGVVRDQSARGLGLLVFAKETPLTTPWLVQNTDGQMRSYHPIYRTRLWGLLPQVGLQIVSSTSDSEKLLADSSRTRNHNAGKPRHMKLRSFAMIGLTLLLMVIGLDLRAGAEDFMESWYLSRGRANMEIENYKAAIEAYEKVVERDPNHREAMRSLGLAYEKQGLKDKAIETFDRYLAKYDDDPEIAFDQAQALEWSRYAYREKDMLKYYRMGLTRKDDSAMRLKYATHLARYKETSQEAIVQYDKVLDRQPRNPEAHRGLAKAYAWLGNNDQALYHANLARQAARRDPGDLTTLRQDMLKGREPTVEGVLGVLVQPEKPFELYGIRIGSRGKVDLTPFTTTILEVGTEHFRSSSENRTGGYLSIGNQIRINPSNRFDAILEHHGAPHGDGLAYKFEYTHESPSFSIRPGVKREFKYDSFASFAGSRTTGQLIGLARSTLFYSTVTFDAGSVHVNLTPFAGWVTSERLSANDQIGLDLKASLPLWQTDRWDLSAEYLFYLTHYGENQSGFVSSTQEPLPGGYFSPQVFVNQIPRLATTYIMENKDELWLAAGPAVQYIDESTQASAFRIGGDAHAAYTNHLSKVWLLKFMGDYTQISTIYTRVQFNALLVYTFY